MAIDRKQFAKLGESYLEEAVIDVLFEAKCARRCIGPAEVCKRSGIYRGHLWQDSIGAGILGKLYDEGRVGRCRQSYSRGGWELTDAEFAKQKDSRAGEARVDEMIARRKRCAAQGQRYLEGAVLDVLLEAKREGKCTGITKVSREAGIYGGSDGSMNYFLCGGILLKLHDEGRIGRCRQNSRGGWELTDAEYERRSGQ